jgi:hypothetical protein
MDLEPYVDEIHRHYALAAEAGGPDAEALAARLIAPLDAAIRLAVQHALADAADEITCELAPGSVELHVRGRELAFVVALPVDNGDMRDDDAEPAPPADALPPDDGGTARINVRMPEQLKTRIDHAAGVQRMSVNAWLVRAAESALDRGNTATQPERRPARGTQRYRGWVK